MAKRAAWHIQVLATADRKPGHNDAGALQVRGTNPGRQRVCAEMHVCSHATHGWWRIRAHECGHVAQFSTSFPHIPAAA